MPDPVELEGQWNLPQINLNVRNEEGAGETFVSSAIKTLGGKKTNVATFKDTDTGARPQPGTTIVKKGDPAPVNSTLRWSGKMMVENKEEDVEAYR